jgi:cytoskeletal protein CcmA (bactofilin family)
MGRSSKTESSSSSNETRQSYQEPAASLGSLYPVATETSQSSSRAVTDSESMARDIKEGRLSGYVGSGTVLTGDTSFSSMLRIDGHLTGRVTSETGTLIVGSTGQVDANIMVASAVINGAVNGDIIATEKLQLGRTAHVVGNIQAPRLVLDDGAILEGNCSMMKAKEALEQRAIEAQRQTYEQEQAAYQTAASGSAETYASADEEEATEAAA